jgi:predicted dehydrogenase
MSDSSKIIAAGTIASAAAAPNISLASSAHVGGTDTIKIGLVGCGGRGTGAAIHAMNTQSGNVELMAMGDAFENRLEGALKACQKQHKEKVKVTQENKHVGFDAFDRVINSDIDMVILATPPGFRPMHFEAAIAADKHVFMEKPVAVDAPGVRRVLKSNELAKQKGLAVQVGLQRRHERAYRETIAELKNGAIGDIVLGRAYWNGAGVWVRPREEKQTELEYQMRNWYYFNWLCGDHIDEQHIHNLDVINWLMDDFPVTANGQGGRQVRTGIDNGEIFDHHFVEFTYANGAKMYSQCRHIPECWNSVSEHCHGTKGSANIGAGRIFDAAGKEIFRTEGSRGGHQQEHHDLFADLRNGIIPNEGEYGAKSTMTAIFGRMATYSGKEIRWEDAIESEISLANVDDFESMKDNPPLKPDEDGRYKIAVPGAGWKDIIDWNPGRKRR